MIGHLLGDGSINYDKTSITFTFILSFNKFDYFWKSFDLLSYLYESIPNLNTSRRKDKLKNNSYYITRSYLFLKQLHNLFYKDINGKFIKFISDDLILNLTPRVLTFLFMDDGSNAKLGYYLHTKNIFIFEDIYKLTGMLHYSFDLNVTVQNHANRPVIYIRAK